MRCQQCPVEPDLSCLGQSHPHVCGTVATPGRADQLRQMALYSAGRAADPALAATAAALRIAADAETCRWAGPSSPCGCGNLPRKCTKPGKPSEVWRSDCLGCVVLPGWDGRPD